jgi:hypothetical protein
MIEIQYPIDTIPSQMFSGCTSLKTIIISGYYILSNGYLDFSQYLFISKIDSSSFSQVSIRLTNFSKIFTSFSPNSFYDWQYLETIEIQYPIAAIPSGMFSGCVSLKTIIINRYYILSHNYLDFSQYKFIASISSDSYSNITIISAKFSSNFSSFPSDAFYNWKFLEAI